MDPKEQTRQSYQEIARQYASKVASLAPFESIDRFMSLLPSTPSILDIGCGSGRDANIFSKKGAKVTGIDFCDNLLSLAKTEAPLAQFFLMDMERLSFPENSFDGAWASSSLVHLSKSTILSVFQKIHAVLKPDGYFYFNLKEGIGEGLEKDERYEGKEEKFWAYYQEEEIKKLLDQSGFQVINFERALKSSSYHSHDVFRVFSYKSP